MKHAELFAGYSGLGLALEEVFGSELSWYAELETAPSKIMAHHYPGITNYGDVTSVDWSQVEPVDIIGGGSPCQDLSLAGRRAGMSDGTRSNLWESMREAIAIIKPTYVVWENVRGALSAKATSASDMEPREGLLGDGGAGHLRALGRVLGDLADLGYDCQWRGLRAADVGAPHGRFRVFVLGVRQDASHAANVRRQGVWAGGHDQGNAATTSDWQNAADANHAGIAFGTLASEQEHAPAKQRGPIHDPSGSRGNEAVKQHGRGSEAGDRASVPHESDCDAVRVGPQREATPYADHIGGDGLGCGSTQDGRRESADGGGAATDWGPYTAAVRHWESALGRPAPAPTELTPKGKHRLSARFVEFLMGLDPGWVTGVDISRNEQLKALGNGVVPQQASAALRDMIAAHRRAV